MTPVCRTIRDGNVGGWAIHGWIARPHHPRERRVH
jgi:hypothetical protein